MSESSRILIVDDERSMRDFLEIAFRRAGYDVQTAEDVDAAMLCIEADDVDVVISDMQMPGKSGLDLLRSVKAISPDTAMVMITAYASTDSAIDAMKEGASDYVTKPFKVDELEVVVERALEKKLLATENRRLRSELRSQVRSRQIIGNSAAMAPVFELIAQVAATKTNVLICGESGTGKELVARAIHDQSERAQKPFVALNCGAIPENLLESELFGHVKGAFTGAVSSKEGLFETAEGGTLFLDEIGELPSSLQVKLLRVIQDKVLRRVGGTQDTTIDVRLISATNRRLEDEVGAGRFREDLYYRLNVIQVTVPALRDRPEDIPLLARHFVDKYAAELGREVHELSGPVLDLIQAYPFPGNVRELENVIERAVALSRQPEILPDVLPPTLLAPADATPTVRVTEDGVDLESLLAEFESALLREALSVAGGVKKKAAKLLGVSFRSFRYRLEKLGLEEPV